jgi:hypothetical protein
MPRPSPYNTLINHMVRNTDKENPKTVLSLSQATGLTEPQVYRLVRKDKHGVLPDCTVSAGIFIAPKSFDQGRQRRYYADTNRMASFAPSSGEFPTHTHGQLVFPTATYSEAVVQRKGAQLQGFAISDLATTRHVITNTFGTDEKRAQYTRPIVESWDKVQELARLAKENHDAVVVGQRVLEPELYRDLRQALIDLYSALAVPLTSLEVLFQHELFDTPEAFWKILDPSYKLPNVVSPTLKEA